MKYIMCAKLFPPYHPKAGRPTGFRESIVNGRKLHTLRASAGNKKNGDIVSLREWSGRPYASKQVEFARCKIAIVPERIWMGGADEFAVMNTAHCDGLSPIDFLHWFTRGKDQPICFVGVCIWFLELIRTDRTKQRRMT